MIRELFASGLLIGTTLGLLITFYFILEHETIILQEPDLGLLVLELLGLLSILAFALANFIMVMRRFRRDKQNRS